MMTIMLSSGNVTILNPDQGAMDNSTEKKHSPSEYREDLIPSFLFVKSNLDLCSFPTAKQASMSYDRSPIRRGVEKRKR